MFPLSVRPLAVCLLLAIVGSPSLGFSQESQPGTTVDHKNANLKTGPVIFTTQQDHQEMLRQLGITKLRPGRNGDEKAPNAANYDESKANPYPELPEVLKLANGEQVTTAAQWLTLRRPEVI